MKELIVRFSDDTATYIASTAKMMGLTSEELVKYIVGDWLRSDKMENPFTLIFSKTESACKRAIDNIYKPLLKERARSGEIKCKNCTLPIKPSDIDSGKCSSCGADLFVKEEKHGSLDDDLFGREI